MGSRKKQSAPSVDIFQNEVDICFNSTKKKLQQKALKQLLEMVPKYHHSDLDSHQQKALLDLLERIDQSWNESNITPLRENMIQLLLAYAGFESASIMFQKARDLSSLLIDYQYNIWSDKEKKWALRVLQTYNPSKTRELVMEAISSWDKKGFKHLKNEIQIKEYVQQFQKDGEMLELELTIQKKKDSVTKEEKKRIEWFLGRI